MHGNGTLRADGAVRYARPLEDDTYRLAQVEGNDKLWVQVSVPDDPADPEGAHFVAAHFVRGTPDPGQPRRHSPRRGARGRQ